MPEDSKNSIVKKSNVLIEAQHAKQLDVRAIRLVAQAASRITVKDKDFQTYQIPVKSISSSPDVYNKSGDAMVIDKITDQLLANVIRLPRKDNDGKFSGESFAKYAYFSKCEYISGSGYVQLQFHPDLKDHFLQLKNNFTRLSLEILCSLPSTYSYRLYELLKQYAQGGIFKRRFVISDLQDMIGVKPGSKSSYRKYPKFREKVLLPAQKNFEKHTDLLFEFRSWAEYGRSYTDIEFKISRNEQYLQGNLFSDNDPTINILVIPQEVSALVPKGQWENKKNGCFQICNEILRDQGLDAVIFYINHTKELDAKEKRTSWGKTIRIALKNQLYEAHLEELANQKAKELEEQEQIKEEQKKVLEEQDRNQKEIEKNDTIDLLIGQVLKSGKVDQFNTFVSAQVNKNENGLVRKRYAKGAEGTKISMRRKYFNLYLESLLV